LRFQKWVPQGDGKHDRYGKARAMQYASSFHEVERVHKGADLQVRRRDTLTGKVISTKLVEVKSGPNARLSPLQKKVKKKKKD
jgi:hypothetical protein